ncbi:hypothetical protein [Halobacillus sp. Cin3]|uniref:hypothetical protein n=1 Tax=Halobacillus sp. Cin3 TaxID=2928441 RepID=UPI00248DEF2F|nr:hypothetical protein [Halobacillus sp. Cin3]
MKNTREELKAWHVALASEKLNEKTQQIMDEMMIHISGQPFELDKTKQKVYAYEALLYEVGKEKFIIEDEDYTIQ